MNRQLGALDSYQSIAIKWQKVEGVYRFGQKFLRLDLRNLHVAVRVSVEQQLLLDAGGQVGEDCQVLGRQLAGHRFLGGLPRRDEDKSENGE